MKNKHDQFHVNSDSLTFGKGDVDEFTEPVLRCDSCQALVRRTTLRQFGSCNKCGNRRVRNLVLFNDEEKAQMDKWGFADFTAEFEGVADE